MVLLVAIGRSARLVDEDAADAVGRAQLDREAIARERRDGHGRVSGNAQ